MKVLLAGGAGYIGTHTAVEMLAAGYDVVIADNFYNSKPEAVKRVEALAGKQVSCYKLDVADKKALTELFEKEKIDAVVHFAGLKAVAESVAKPVAYYRNNLDTTLTLLEVMKEQGCRRLIFSSSATVYGEPEVLPLVESMKPGFCASPYGWTKWMIEQILRDTCKAEKDLSVVLLRYFNPIGAHESGSIGEDPQGIPNNLFPYIAQVAVGKRPKLSIFGNDYPTKDGTCIRDYVHVVDLAKGHVKATAYAMNHDGLETINLGTGRGYSVLEMVHAFEKVNGVPVPHEFAPRRPGDVPECYADASKAKELLGWEAEKSLEDMCRDTYRWQSMNPQGYPEN